MFLVKFPTFMYFYFLTNLFNSIFIFYLKEWYKISNKNNNFPSSFALRIYVHIKYSSSPLYLSLINIFCGLVLFFCLLRRKGERKDLFKLDFYFLVKENYNQKFLTLRKLSPKVLLIELALIFPFH